VGCWGAVKLTWHSKEQHCWGEDTGDTGQKVQKQGTSARTQAGKHVDTHVRFGAQTCGGHACTLTAQAEGEGALTTCSTLFFWNGNRKAGYFLSLQGTALPDPTRWTAALTIMSTMVSMVWLMTSSAPMLCPQSAAVKLRLYVWSVAIMLRRGSWGGMGENEPGLCHCASSSAHPVGLMIRDGWGGHCRANTDTPRSSVGQGQLMEG
jgi:hypothetical protein